MGSEEPITTLVFIGGRIQRMTVRLSRSEELVSECIAPWSEGRPFRKVLLDAQQGTCGREALAGQARRRPIDCRLITADCHMPLTKRRRPISAKDGNGAGQRGGSGSLAGIAGRVPSDPISIRYPQAIAALLSTALRFRSTPSKMVLDKIDPDPLIRPALPIANHTISMR